MLAEMGSDELGEWQAYTLVAGPIGEARADVRTAQIVSTLVNVNRVKGKAATLSDCLLEWDTAPKPRRTPEEMVLRGKMMCLALGGEIKG